MENKLTAVIIDDESNSRDVLRNLLESFFTEIDLLGEAENVESGFQLILAEKPELVFLDIQMPGKSGFSLLKKFEEIPFEVIFVTSYDRYAINAIKFSALDYLLKPVEIAELKETIRRARKNFERKTRPVLQIVNLLDSIDESKEKKVVVHAGGIVRLLKTSEIIYIEAAGRYSTITTTENKQHVTAKSLKEFGDYFGTGSALIRIHKSCMINTRHLKAYSKGEPSHMEMVNGKVFEVARRKKVEILEFMKKNF